MGTKAHFRDKGMITVQSTLDIVKLTSLFLRLSMRAFYDPFATSRARDRTQILGKSVVAKLKERSSENLCVNCSSRKISSNFHAKLHTLTLQGTLEAF